MHEFYGLSSNARKQLGPWMTATAFDDLLAMNTSYPKGGMIVHPGHGEAQLPGKVAQAEQLIETNTYGILTSQSQPWSAGGDGEVMGPAGEGHFLPREPDSLDRAAHCRWCNMVFMDPDVWLVRRQLPVIQFCVLARPDDVNDKTVGQATALAQTLLRDKRSHTQVSWPLPLPLPQHMPWREADLSQSSYAPKYDRDMFHHFKSLHGTSCSDECRRAAAKDGLAYAEWLPSQDLELTQAASGAETNVYHLIRPRMPRWFLSPHHQPHPVVCGVNLNDHADKLDVGKVVVEHAKKVGIEQRFDVGEVEARSKATWETMLGLEEKLLAGCK